MRKWNRQNQTERDNVERGDELIGMIDWVTVQLSRNVFGMRMDIYQKEKWEVLTNLTEQTWPT